MAFPFSIRQLMAASLGRKVAVRDYNVDFGYPDIVDFDVFMNFYKRHSLAASAVDKTANKTFSSVPYLLEGSVTHTETPLEVDIRKHLASIRFWSKFNEADKRSMVGGYAGLILRLRDGMTWDQPVARIKDISDLIEVIPAWRNQLTVKSWNEDQKSEEYGQPIMYQFQESNTSGTGINRSVDIHPDRVLIISDDGTLDCPSSLEPGLNDLIDVLKVRGAGGEGFWKNAKNSPVFEVDPEADIRKMAKAMGVEPSEVQSKLSEAVERWTTGFDESLVLQSMKANTLGVTLPQPGEFYNISMMSFAASMFIPSKILVGNQTGERASEEDNEEWNQTCESRRQWRIMPIIEEFVSRLEAWGAIPDGDWYIQWESLVDDSPVERMDRAKAMTEVNSSATTYGSAIFSEDEIREAAGFDPMNEEEGLVDDEDQEDDDIEDPEDAPTQE